ncbi:ATP-binding cassette domain-containing protein, partial [Candidatus Dojkabacteria bacterium]|nr:ATP-binding cassette domain-containing protein [Candidatus Dojkabacteria bacterium]
MLEKNPIIHLKEVNKVFQVKSQDVWVLKNINLEIYPGEFVVVFGPSGSGKSTILHVMLGLEPPTRGDAEILGLQIYQKGENELCDYRKKFVGIIYQQPNWVKSLSVLENVAFPLVMQGMK